MDNVTLRAMVRGMWKDARNLADRGKPNVFIYSNRCDFACSYTFGFYDVERMKRGGSWPTITAVLLNGAATHRRKGDLKAARQFVQNARFANKCATEHPFK